MIFVPKKLTESCAVLEGINCEVRQSPENDSIQIEGIFNDSRSRNTRSQNVLFGGQVFWICDTIGVANEAGKQGEYIS